MTTRIALLLVLFIIAAGLGTLWYESFIAAPLPAPVDTQASAAQATSTAASNQQSAVPASTTSSSQKTSSGPSESVVASGIVGTWQSSDDPNYVIQVSSNGAWKDTYTGDQSATEVGTYTLFTSAKPDKGFTGPLVPGVVYIKVVEGKTTVYFSVLALTSDSLQLSYLDRGNTLSFKKEQ